MSGQHPPLSILRTPSHLSVPARTCSASAAPLTARRCAQQPPARACTRVYMQRVSSAGYRALGLGLKRTKTLARLSFAGSKMGDEAVSGCAWLPGSVR